MKQYRLDNNEEWKHFRISLEDTDAQTWVLYFWDEARELWKQIILEYFEWNEICNPDWEYSERDNLARVENIFDDYISQSHWYKILEQYLHDEYSLTK